MSICADPMPLECGRRAAALTAGRKSKNRHYGEPSVYHGLRFCARGGPCSSPSPPPTLQALCLVGRTRQARNTPRYEDAREGTRVCASRAGEGLPQREVHCGSRFLHCGFRVLHWGCEVLHCEVRCVTSLSLVSQENGRQETQSLRSCAVSGPGRRRGEEWYLVCPPNQEDPPRRDSREGNRRLRLQRRIEAYPAAQGEGQYLVSQPPEYPSTLAKQPRQANP